MADEERADDEPEADEALEPNEDESAEDEGAEDERADDDDDDQGDRPSHRDEPAGPARTVVAGLVALAAVAAVAGLAMHRAQPPARCAEGLEAVGTRCCGVGQTLFGDRCNGPPQSCAVGMERTEIGCVAKRQRISLPGGQLTVAPHDWEAAERRVRPRQANVSAFAIDSHEIIEQQWDRCAAAKGCVTIELSGEPGRPMVGVSAVEAEAFCRWAGGRLPTSDEWAYAASGTASKRYPWGDTGAVCRRAAFGLHDGPCATGAKGPELAGAHPEGATSTGIYDLAGNVGEWTQPLTEGKRAGKALVRGGSWRERTAADLRTYSERLVDAKSRSDAIGFRCIYPAGATSPASEPGATP